jgi:hypothetical protein
MVGDKREVVVTFAITDLIDPENEEIPKAVGIELLGATTRSQIVPRRTPCDAEQFGHAVVRVIWYGHLGACPSYQVFEVPREARLPNLLGKGYRFA